MLKIAVYSIALNEERFVSRWADSARSADLLVVGDTGSMDKTKNELFVSGVKTYDLLVSPFRFDTARNALLALLPPDIDICVSLDLDEVLVSGWRQKLETAWASNPLATRVRYDYTWKTEPSGDLEFRTDKIHSRKDYVWKYPCHETLVYCGTSREVIVDSDLKIIHKADETKSRGQYLGLLAQSAKENPHDGRAQFYYARELFYWSKYWEAFEQFEAYLKIPNCWSREVAEASTFQGQCCTRLGRDPRPYYYKSLARQETAAALLYLGRSYYDQGQWNSCVYYIIAALNFPTDISYLNCRDLLSSLPYDLISIAYFNLGKQAKAKEFCESALLRDPLNSRLKQNLRKICENINQ